MDATLALLVTPGTSLGLSKLVISRTYTSLVPRGFVKRWEHLFDRVGLGNFWQALKTLLLPSQGYRQMQNWRPGGYLRFTLG